MLECRYASSIYYNQENGYTVAVYETEDEIPEGKKEIGKQQFIAVGCELPRNEGLDISLKGQWKESERYGKQYHVASFEIQMPTTGEGVKAYLSSGLIKGVGPIIAERIVDRFGKNTFYVFEQCPERLLEIPGITQRKLDSILEGYHKSENIRQLSLFLSSAGVTPKKIEKIQEHFGHKAVSIIKKDPFRLCEMEGFGFKTVDPIARKVKHFQADNPLRIKAAILYVLKEAEGEGHLYLEVPEILTRTKSLLFRGDKRGHVTERKIRDAGNSLIKDDKELVCSYTKIYSKKNYESEQKAVIQLAALSRYPIKRYDVEKWISGLESKENIQLAEKQRKGIEMVFQNPVSIITGGPGSGKTTLLRFIVMIQEKLNMDSMILLAAPTGRARQRMYEATGYPALTIHKSIGFTGAEGEEAWNAGEMLCDDLIIIDECSMVDMHLFTSLMMKIKAGSRIVFVGDKDQLESVGPGNVFKELIDSGVIPVTVLEQCFRQENPTILENAIKINCGKQNLVYDDSFSFVTAHDDEEAAKKIVKIFDTEWNQQGKNVNAVQVLTPLREDTKVSANALNIKIKDRINPYQRGQQEIKSGNKIFRIQDKVMQTKNEDEISNGDIGIVRKIGKMNGKKYMEVDFGEERVMRYQEGESWNLVHAYAITAHKGQGSEYAALDSVERNISDGEELLAMLIYVSLEKKEALYNLEFAQNFILFMQQMKEGWKNAKLALKAAFLCCDNLYRRVENVQDFSNEGIPLEKSQLGKNGMEQLSTLAIESELYAPNDAIKGTFRIFGETKKVREWTLKELQKIYRQHWQVSKDYQDRIPRLPEDMKVGEYAQDILSAIVESPFRKFMITGNAGTGKTTDAQI